MGTHYSHLDLASRIEIYRLHAGGKSLQQIADHVGCHKCTVSRELARNSGATKSWKGGYDPQRADALYRRRRQWDCRLKLVRQPALGAHVRQRLAMGLSPEQIAGRLALEGASSTVSKEAIYRYVYHCVAQKDYLNRLLPRGKYQRGKRGKPGGSPLRLIRDRVAIAERPKVIANRRRFGDWEGDLMAFRHNRGNILICHERKSRLVLAVRLKAKTARRTAKALAAVFRQLPKALRRSATFDNGPEFFNHWTLNSQLAMPTYFCDTHAPWQKGGIENAIRRIRRWLPRKANPAKLSSESFNAIIHAYNSTPRKCLGFRTPAEVFMRKLKPLHFNRDSACQPSLA